MLDLVNSAAFLGTKISNSQLAPLLLSSQFLLFCLWFSDPRHPTEKNESITDWNRSIMRTAA